MKPTLALSAGYHLENLQIQSILGKGGFGITYVAVDTRIGLRVAIKELLPDTIATRAEGARVVPQTESMLENWQWARERFLGKRLSQAESKQNFENMQK
jgi:serine/threonine protein kinase